MKVQRIVSFLPSATELIYEFKKEELLFGVTHECKYPPEANSKLKIIDSVIDSDKLTSNEINETTCQLLTEGKSVFYLNEENLKKAQPDLIIFQEICEACAAYTKQVNKALETLEKKPNLYAMNPHTLEEILETVTELGEILEERKKADEIKKNLEERICKIKESNVGGKPRTLAIEWMDPFFTAGHWVPELIEIAGGINLISHKGEHSRKMDLEEILRSDPDIIVLMPCGFNLERTVDEYDKILRNDHSWNELRAVKNKKLFAVDANSFFSKPSIRTISGLEILSKIIQPAKFSSITVPDNSFCSIEN